MSREKNHHNLSAKELYARPVLPALLVFVALMALISLSSRTARHDLNTQRSSTVNEDSSVVENGLKQRFSIYETTLRAANGLFLGSDSVTRTEWTDFINSLDLPVSYPGIRSVGFIRVIPAVEKDDFVASVQANDLNSFNIYPSRDSDSYAPILYSVPTISKDSNNSSTSTALGFDMYSESDRHKALDATAASGMPTFSNILTSTQTQTTSSPLKGFLMLLPYYKKGMPTATKDERVAAIDGFFYAPFATEGIFPSVFTQKQNAFAFSIYDGTPSKTTLLYSNVPATSGYQEVKRSILRLYGQQWTIVYEASKAIVPASVSQRPVNSLIGGTIFAAALAMVIYLLIQRRTRTLAYSEQKRLEEAKDELLSLASHQLRTPATAVKQYVSMVMDGFAGKLSKEQRKLLNAAYDSNERQLTIVDDLLYVARIDAGQMVINIETVDVGEILSSVIEDQYSAVMTRKQKLNFKKSKSKRIIVEADPTYLRMILENLLSNASKYSYEGTEIKINMTTNNKQIMVSFTDEGVGISSENYSQVFVRFSRIPNELSRQIAGSGIGLYLAKQLALLHSGDITFTSMPGRGTTFTLTLPKHQAKK